MKHHIFSLATGAVVLGAGIVLAQPRQPIRPGTTLAQPLGAQVLQRMNLRASINADLRLQSPTIADARGALGDAKLNQLVKVRGFYYDGSIPMVVDSIERTQCDMVMPAQSYVPLASRVADLQNGDEVTIEGRLVTPNAVGLQLEKEESVLRLEAPAKTAVQVLRPRANNILKLNPNISIFKPGVLVPLAPRKYAVLISGGASAADNHVRYWNDLKTMYAILLARGYPKANITVIYANGTGRDGSTPVNYSASKANINTAFKNLGDKMKFNDDLYVMINDHGGGFLGQQIGSYGPGSYGAVLDTSGSIGTGWSEQAYNRDLNYDGDKNDTVHFHNTVALWGELMTENEFAAALDQVKNYDTMMIQMKQCFSGGFTRALRNPKRIAMSSAGPNELSWSHSSGNYGEFTYHYFAALTGKLPDAATTVNADSSGDGKISLAEAWNYARTKDTKPETGWYADTASNPATGNMPAGGQGTLGAKTIL